MSGPICPECSCPHLVVDPDEDWNAGNGRCKLCGWEGKFDPNLRRTLRPEHHSRCAQKLEAKEAGKLFFLKIYVEEGADKTKAMSPVTKLLDISSYSSKGNFIMLEREERPTEELMAEIEACDGIEKVAVF